jgi:hypothetical protein
MPQNAHREQAKVVNIGSRDVPATMQRPVETVKRLRIIIPVAQIVTLLLILLFLNLANAHTRFFYINPLRELILQLNFPLFVLWGHTIGFVSRLFGNSTDNPSSLFTVVQMLGSVAFVITFFLMWYVVLREIQLRIQGKSLLKRSAGPGEWTKDIAFFICGCAVLISAYFYASGLFNTLHLLKSGVLYRPSDAWLWRAEAVGLGFVRAAWGMAFIGIAAVDFRGMLRGRHRGSIGISQRLTGDGSGRGL